MDARQEPIEAGAVMIGESRESAAAAVAAEMAGLVYVSDEEPGIRRRRSGRGFSYRALNDNERAVEEANRLGPQETNLLAADKEPAHEDPVDIDKPVGDDTDPIERRA